MLDIKFGDFPILKTQRLVLKRVTNNDAPQIFKMRTDKRVHQYLDLRIEETIEETKALIKRIDDAFIQNGGLSWAITLHGDDAIIGTFGFWRIMKEHHRAEIGYSLHPDYWSRGIMTEAAITAIQYGFDVLKFHSLEANINPANSASIKLIERLNFKQEAFFKENYFYNGQFLDSVIFSLVVGNEKR